MSQTLAARGLERLLSGYRFRYTDEIELQDGIAEVLTRAGIQFEREVVLPRRDQLDFLRRDRIDFLVTPGIGIEVKIRGSRVDVMRQLARYAEHERIESLILVTDRSQFAMMPLALGGKLITVVNLLGGLRG